MQDLSRFHDAELEAELERRKREREARIKPKPLDNPNWQPLINSCVEYIEYIAQKGYEQKDSSHFIFEAAMTVVFGKDVWAWINNKLR